MLAGQFDKLKAVVQTLTTADQLKAMIDLAETLPSFEKRELLEACRKRANALSQALGS
jgi:hypothetical protein